MTDEELAPARAQLERLGDRLPRRRRAIIVTHDYPDPDALAAAGALHLLLRRHFGVPSQIVFSGAVSRAENMRLLRHFRYRCLPLDDLHPSRQVRPSLFVDTQPWSGNVTLPDRTRPVAVFDHHPPAEPPPEWKDRAHIDVRPTAGATATILHQYLAAADIPEPPWLAAIMAYAILTETTEFTRSFEPADLQAYLELLPRANLRLIGDIRNAPLPPAYFAQLREALDRARVYGRTVWSELDEVLQPEIVAEIADRLVRMERITWCFCAARHGTRLLLSLRSNRPGARCGQTLRRVIGRAGSGGGHDRLAAGYVELAGLSPDAAAARRRRIITQLVRRLERRMATDGDPLELSRPLLAPAAAEKSDDAPTSPDS